MVEEVENEEELEEQQDEQMEDQMDKQHDLQQENQEYYDTTPSYGSKDDLWTLFRWVVAKEDSTKIGNLNERELGMLLFSTRSCQDIALQAEVMNKKGFKTFWRKRGENILASSLSRNMAQQNLFVSQTKKRTTEKKIDSGQQQQPQQQKKGFFKRWGG
jgi:hypothetical protein